MKITQSKEQEKTRIVIYTYTLGTQSLTVLSRDAEAIRCPEGENLTERTAS